MVRLCDVAEGKLVRIIKVEGSERFLARVTSIGITVGCSIQIIQNVKKRPVLVYCRDTSVAVDRDDCANIFVEVAA